MCDPLMLMTTCALALLAVPADSAMTVVRGKESLAATSRYLDVEASRTRPQLIRLSVDSLGLGRFRPSALQCPSVATRTMVAQIGNSCIEYRQQGIPPSAPARWIITFDSRCITLTSCWSQNDSPEPIVLDFDQSHCHVTLLGIINSDGSVQLPALMHLPDQGTFRITANTEKGVSLGYEAGNGSVKIRLSPASAARPRLEYRLDVCAIHPQLVGLEKDARFNGFRRNWLNALQLSPSRRILANHAASDNCAFCMYKYADIARYTPPLVGGLNALDILRQSLERYLDGFLGYGMTGRPGPDGIPNKCPPFLDTYPSLLIAAADYVQGSDDTAWLRKHYGGLQQWTNVLLAMDRDNNGLIEYPLSGNSGSWSGNENERPANWWDCIGFGHEDAYSNALAYRALRNMQSLAEKLGNTDDATRYRVAADRLRNGYFNAFFNPASGILAGWRSKDGQLHDYYFPFVNGIAIHYGLVPDDKANAIMDKLLAKMKEVDYTRFDLGLPGNLVPVAPRDYFTQDKRWGGGPGGFQIYENGGATACFAYFTLAALYDLGRRDEADRMLFPMLEAFEKGSFQGSGINGMTNDWKTWDGTPHGYEGFLVDNYYALLAVVAREGQHKSPTAPR